MAVYSAFKFFHKASLAPSTVSVIAAADIQTFGYGAPWPTCCAACAACMSRTTATTAIWARAVFLRPGDYNTRFLLQINVITKRARDLDDVRASVEAGQYGARRGSSSLAWGDTQGNALLLSASRYTNDGRNLYFREFDNSFQNAGVTSALA